MRATHLLLTLALCLFTASCSAQADNTAQDGKKSQKGSKKGGKKHKAAAAPVANLTPTGKMRGLAESSGIAPAAEAGTFWTHGDHGNRPELYHINWQGDVLATVPVRGASAVDWEALAHDDQGRLYIGDVGNNANNRKDLTVYRFDPARPGTAPARIRFRYADQQAFPPADKTARNFDCEALLWHQGTLYLFTRDRGQHRMCRIYALAAEPGEGIAKYVGSIELPGEVSGVDLSPDGRELALIGHSQLFLVALPGVGQFIGGTVRAIPLPGAGQTEGVAYTDARTLIITAEQGTVFRYDLK